MKIALFIILLLALASSVTKCSNKEKEGIDVYYCEKDTDCVFREGSHCRDAIGVAVNEKLYKDKFGTDPKVLSGPFCYTAQISDDLRRTYCGEDNKCHTEVDCTKCDILKPLQDCKATGGQYAPACRAYISCDCSTREA